MKLSIVATLYQSASHVIEFYERASGIAREFAGDDYEIILVNDGSPDNSFDLILPFTKKDEHLSIIDLSRNFGHHKAMMTGLAHAKGERVFLIDSDLEEAPEWLLAFSTHMEKTGSDVVYGVQEKRKGNLFERFTGMLYYKMMNTVMNCKLPANITTARLMTRRYVEALLSHGEREMSISGLWQLTGFLQTPLTVKKLSHSISTYTFGKKIASLMNSVTSFSNKPLIFIFYIGLMIFSSASAYTLYLIISWLFFTKPLNGWTSLMASVWLLGGIIILFIGTIGLYLSKIFLETKQRPYTIVRAIHKKVSE